MIWTHRDEFGSHASEVEVVVTFERDVGLAEIRVLKQVGIDRGAAGEDLGEPQAGLGDVFDLIA
jgi:hypothetical protein